MNDVLVQLLNVREDIKHAGYLSIPPSPNPYELKIRVEWYADEKHGYEQQFTEIELRDCNVNLLDRFIADANDFIVSVLGE